MSSSIVNPKWTLTEKKINIVPLFQGNQHVRTSNIWHSKTHLLLDSTVNKKSPSLTSYWRSLGKAESPLFPSDWPGSHAPARQKRRVSHQSPQVWGDPSRVWNRFFKSTSLLLLNPVSMFFCFWLPCSLMFLLNKWGERLSVLDVWCKLPSTLKQ